MMLEDEAKVAISMVSAPVTVRNNGSEVTSTSTISTCDEEAQASIESKESTINNPSDTACVNVPTQEVLKETPANKVNHASRPDERESANTATNSAEISELLPTTSD